MNNCSFTIFIKLKLPNKSFVINTSNTKICKLPRAKQQVPQEKTMYTESLSYKDDSGNLKISTYPTRDTEICGSAAKLL